MVDGTNLNSMSGGDKVDTEDIGVRGKLQRIKVVTGAIDTDGGDVSSSNPLPTNDSSLNTVQGLITDAAVTGDNTGTVSAKLRGLSKILANVWDNVNGLLKVTLYAGGTALQQSGGNLLVNVQNFGVGAFGNQDANAATTTSALTFAYLELFNGTTWDRARGDTTNGMWVNVKNTPTVQDIPQTTGGLTPYKLISTATTNATSVKASAGQVYNIAAFNTTASVAYLKLYDKASAPTVGTDTPKHTYVLPANSTNGAGFVLNIDKGINFASGIAFAITGAITDVDSTAVAANQVVVNLDYK